MSIEQTVQVKLVHLAVQTDQVGYSLTYKEYKTRSSSQTSTSDSPNRTGRIFLNIQRV